MLARTLARRPNRRQSGVAAAVMIAVASLTLGVLAQGGAPSPPTAAASSTPRPSPIAVTPTNASPPAADPSARTPESSGEPGAPWSPVELAPLAAVATLEPSSRDDAGIPPDATFELASLTGEPARAIADHLAVSPATEFTVSDAAGPTTVTVRPNAPLTGGSTYRFELRAQDGSVAGSWAFRVRGPVAVTSTIPRDATTNVPLRTGIEITFDQDGIADMADHFSIRPAVTGTFERHGRTQVFVPATLAPATTYTVTVRKGLTRSGTDLRLPDDVVVRFETDGPSEEQARLIFAREVIEAAPGQSLTVAVEAIRPWLGDERAPAPTAASLRIYRLPSLNAASRALTDFLQAPRWTRYSDPSIPTTGLRVVAAFRGSLVPLARDILGLDVPVELDPGWYILEIQGARRSQAFLQVTPVSSWVSVMSDRTVVWVNDVVTHRALEGATVSIGAARPFATSDVDGLAVGATPKALVPAVAGGASDLGSPILRVTSRAGAVVLVPFNVGGDDRAYRGEWWETYGSADETYWSLLYTDRELYRQTDLIEVWGYLRGRDDGRVPGTIELRLVSTRAADNPDVTAVASVDAHPGADGAFTASLPVVNLPLVSYEVQAVVDGRVVASRWVDVTVIRKPPYQLELTATPLAVITGTPVTVTADATFFDDTPVASLDLALTGDEAIPDQRLTTDGTGHATATIDTATTSVSHEDWRWVNVRPAGPESADISGTATVVIFPSAYDLAASGVVSAGRLRLAGKVTMVDLAKVRRLLAAGSWDGDASGAAVAGVKVRATITELVPTRRQVGTEYDFLEKVARPVYEYDYTRKVLDTVSTVSAGDGTIRYSVPVVHAGHTYEVELSTKDRAGRAQHLTVWVGPTEPDAASDGIQFVTDDGSPANGTEYRIGDRVSWRIVDDGRGLPSGSVDRYLFVVAQRGLRAAAVTDVPRFRHTFAAADAPGVFVMGVRFTGTTYAPKAAAWADFDESQRAIRVAITADRERYRPGETVGLSVRTTDAAGSPVAATVVLQAVDEKLYAMGGARVPRPLPDLYARVDSGIVRLTATHQVPSMAGPEGEGGDTTGGGGDRTDFHDTLLFRELRTDASGLASTSLRLSDDLTSWHVSASAVTGGLAAGVGELLVPVGLPFFVELTVADSYLAADRPVIQVRAFGDALRAGDRVEFTVASPSLGLAETKLSGTAFKPVGFALPALTVGRPSIAVGAVAVTRTDSAGRPLGDRLTRSFEVVASRLTKAMADYVLLRDGLPRMPDGAERATWTFADAGRGRLLPILSGLAEAWGLRLDRAIAQTAARQILVETFQRDAAAFPPSSVDLSRYPIGTTRDGGEVAEGGVSLVPYGSLDPWLAARVALLAPDALATSELREALESIRDAPTTRRDLQVAALAGLAGLGEPVLDDLHDAARQPSLTPTERIYLALGFEAVGDDPSAIVLERELLKSDGERLGAWVRLRDARTADGADATALLSVVAAGVGDPVGTALADYAWAHPATDTVNALELAAYAKRALARTPAAAASFAYTVAGRRTVVRLDPGESFSLQLTAAQAGKLSAAPLSGEVGVTVEARVPVAPSNSPSTCGREARPCHPGATHRRRPHRRGQPHRHLCRGCSGRLLRRGRGRAVRARSARHRLGRDRRARDHLAFERGRPGGPLLCRQRSCDRPGSEAPIPGQGRQRGDVRLGAGHPAARQRTGADGRHAGLDDANRDALTYARCRRLRSLRPFPRQADDVLAVTRRLNG